MLKNKADQEYETGIQEKYPYPAKYNSIIELKVVEYKRIATLDYSSSIA